VTPTALAEKFIKDRRWDSDYLTLSKLIKSNTLGRIVEFETHFDRHRPDPPADTWKSKPIPGGGAIYDLGSHLMDQVVAIFGLPARITAFIGSHRVGEWKVDDSFTVLLHYKDGMTGVCKATVVSPEVEQLRYWVRGDKGSFKKFHLDCQEDQLRGGMKPGDEGFALEDKARYGMSIIT
jgi:predicted dehydrogenase